MVRTVRFFLLALSLLVSGAAQALILEVLPAAQTVGQGDGVSVDVVVGDPGRLRRR